MNSFFEHVILTLGPWTMDLAQLMGAIFVVFSAIYLYRWIVKSTSFNGLFLHSSIPGKEISKLKRLLVLGIALISIIALLGILNLDYAFSQKYSYLKASVIFKGILILLLARLFDWILSHVLIHRLYVNRDQPKKKSSKVFNELQGEKNATRVVQFIVYCIAIILFLRNLNIDPTIFSTHIKNEVFEFKLSKVFTIIAIILTARLIVWLLIQLFLYGIYHRRKVDPGSQFAINQLLKYLVYIIAAVLALDQTGINMTIVWTGAAALLVGVGLGLQQTFNDFISGIVLLFERNTAVGDVLEMEDVTGTVKKIGMRSSLIETTRNLTIIIPNSKLVNESVVNLSHFNNMVRNEIKVGVAYESDTELVKEVLVSAAKEHFDVVSYPEPFVRFVDFGQFSLDFILSFYIKKHMEIEDIKSDIRFKIDNRFKHNKIEIPFPQREVRITSQGE